MKSRFLVSSSSLCVAIVVIVSVSAISPIQAATPSFQNVVDAAKKEAARGSTFTVYALSPRDEGTRKTVLDAFKKKYGLPDFRAEWLMLHQNVSVPRVISEINAGRSGPDIFEPSINWALDAKRAGILEPFDWVGTFGRELPGIQDAADYRVLREVKGMWVLTQDATRGFVYNTGMLKPPELPSEIEDLANPKWSRKFALGGTTSPFDLFVLLWGEERTVQVVKKLLANKPIFVKGTPAVVNAVAAGQAPIGLGSIHDTERLKLTKGAPVDWKTYGNYLPVLGLGFSITSKAPHPNLARLFTAWFATEGAAIWEDLEGITRVTREGSRLQELFKQRGLNIKIVEPRNQQEYELFEATRAKLETMVPTGR
jgi:iron(III) transport system substrate-binding protein